MSLIQKLKALVSVSPEISTGQIPQVLGISRRTFFSFFGTGVVMLAKPDLLLPQGPIFPYPKIEILTAAASPTLFLPDLRKEFARTYAKIYREQLDKFTFFKMMDSCSNIAPPLNAHTAEDLYAYYQEESKSDRGWELNGGPSI